MANMGDRIRELRREKGWTLEELSAMVSMQPSNLSKYERGNIENMKRSTIERLAELFDVCPSYLMGYTDERYPLDSILSRLDAEDRQTILDMANVLLRKEKYQ